MDEIREIYADKIIDPVDPMRSDLDRDTIDELARSIKREGLINPITVRPAGDKFEVVAGHRRFRACMIAGVVKIQCMVKELTDEQVFEIRAHENLFREDVDPVDEAIYIQKLLNELDCSVKELSGLMKKSEALIYNRLAILELPYYLIEFVGEKKISTAAAITLMKITDQF